MVILGLCIEEQLNRQHILTEHTALLTATS